MTRDELLKLTGAPPAFLPDGKMGLLIRWPTSDDGECGFQVPGEENIRWYTLDRVSDSGNGALVVSKPENPND